MSNISQWNVAAASNNSAAPDGAPEGMAPSAVNDTMREMMAAIARWFSDADGSLTTGGTGNAYTLTTNNTSAALADIGLLVFQADRANTGAATLNVDSLGAKSLIADGAALASGDITADAVYAVVYDSTNDAFNIVNSKVGLGSLAAKSTINDDDWSGTDLAVANGGTGASTAAAARTALAVPINTLADANFSGITSVAGNALEAGDDFLVMDDTTAKRIPFSSAGVPSNNISGTSDTLATADMNTILRYTNGSAVTVTLNTGVGVKGNFILIEQAGAGQVTVSGSATVTAAIGKKTRTQYSVICLYCHATDNWTLYGDMAA